MKKLLTGICLLSACFAAGQKLPDTQQGPLNAPANIRIDGKMNEWNGFSAFNKKVLLSYSVANDDKKVYFAIQADDVTIIDKILRGGIIIAVNPAGKTEKGASSITFPYISPGESSRMLQEIDAISRSVTGDSSNRSSAAARINELRDELNRKNINRLKDMRVLGIRQVSDTLLSVYNEEGILARAAFDDDGYYNYELAVPRSFLLAADQQTFYYSIRLPGLVIPLRRGADILSVNVNPKPGPGKRGASKADVITNTFFWTTYTLFR